MIECGNGLILDAADGWKVISNSLYKFFNYGQPLADTNKIDWDSARVFELVDGTLCAMFPRFVVIVNDNQTIFL